MSPRKAVIPLDSDAPEIRFLPVWAKKTQAPQFYSMARGFKAAMDTWVPKALYPEFLEYCDRFGLVCIPDVKFVKAENYSEYANSVWGEHLTTTKTLAENVDSDVDGEIHCFVSSDRFRAEEAFRYGWYPVVRDGRVVYKSFHDTIEFWFRLGYPKCCVDFFFQKNDWNSFNFPYEIYKKSERFDFRCNPFWKDVGGSYVYHMPCRFDCPETVAWVEGVRNALLEKDADYVAALERRLKFPVLSVREQKTYAFEWFRSSDGSLEYDAFYRLGKEEEGDLSSLFEKWNRLKVSETGHISVFSDGTPVGEYVPVRVPGAIESPFIAFFE